MRMPTEMRRIVFSNEELLNAINFFNSPNIPKLPEGVITSASVDPENKSNMILKFNSYNRDAERDIIVPVASLGAVLINYCIKSKIPMSKKASKSLKIIGDNVSLELVFGNDQIALK